MKIVIASKGDPKNVKTWSGIPYYIYAALQKKGYPIVGINLIDPKEPWYYGLYRRIVYKLSKKWFWAEMEPYILKKIAHQFDKDVNAVKPDIVLLIHGHFLAYTTFEQPTIVVHDTTFAQIITYYSDFTKFTNRTIQFGNYAYQRSLNRAAAAVFSSSWATQSALVDYDTNASKIYTIPFGANLPTIPAMEEVKQWISNRTKERVCYFLFVGIEWERKGGPDALRFVVELNRKGIKSYLTIVGCLPEIPADVKDFVYLIGFLRKDVEEEAKSSMNYLKNLQLFFFCHWLSVMAAFTAKQMRMAYRHSAVIRVVCQKLSRITSMDFL